MALTEKQKEWYLDQLRQLDPSNNVVKIDDDTGNLIYSSQLKSDECRIKPPEPEELVHATAISLLVSSQYKYPITALYHEKYYPHGSAGSLSDEADIVINDDDGLPYALWELKASDEYERSEKKAIQYQLFGTAPLVGGVKLLVYATIKPSGPKAKFELKCIDFSRYKSYEAWLDAGKPFSTRFPSDYQDLDYKPYVNGGDPDLKLDCTQSEFRAVASSFHNEFFGEHPDNALYVSLVKCLLAKIHDERTTKRGSQYRFQVLYRNNRPQSAKEVFSEINSLYQEAYLRYIEPFAKQADEIDPREFSPDKVKSVVLALQSMSITKGAALHGDVIGAFFEEILRVGFKQDKGMYFTHANLVRFIIEAVDLKGLTKDVWESATHPENRLPYVIDPASGSGSFLLQAMRSITDFVKANASELVDDFEAKQFYQARLSDESPNYWAENFVYGFDPKFIMAITAKVNMVLHGDGSAHMFKEDAFRPFSSYPDTKLRPIGDEQRTIPFAEYPHDMCETFDVVLSNPPFGITLASETRRTLGKTFSLPETLPSEALFIERCFQLLKPNGRLGLVLPESIFNASDLYPVRKFLYRMFDIKAIVALPRNIFIDTPTLTSLLFARKKTGAEIAAWDADWKRIEEKANTKVQAAKRLVSKKALATVASAKALESSVLACLHPVITRHDWVVKKGKHPERLLFTLPAHIKSTTAAGDYFKKLLATASIRRYIENFVFSEVVKEHDSKHAACSVSEVGYKLSKRKERARPNQLLTMRGKDSKVDIRNLHLCEEEPEVVINATRPKTALDFIRAKVKW